MIRRLLITIVFTGIAVAGCSTTVDRPPSPNSGQHTHITKTIETTTTVAQTTTTTVAPPTTTTIPPVTTTTVAPTPAPVPVPTTVPTSAPVATSGDLYAEWTKVAVCEEGGWIGYAGPAYPDSLGIDAQNWYANGGGSDVSPSAQIAVAERLVASLGMPNYVPDQNGCAAW